MTFRTDTTDIGQLNYNKNDSFNIAILNNPDLQSVNKMTKWPYAEVVVY